MKNRKTTLALAAAILSAVVAIAGAFGMQDRVRNVDILTLFFGGVGAGVGVTVAIMRLEGRRPGVFPAVKYQDGPAAIAWLERAFGFTTLRVMPAADGTITHAELRYGPGVLILGSLGKPDSTNPWSTAAQALYVHVQDVDAHHSRARAAGADVVREPHNTDYGAREYSARDLEGRLWSFGTYYPDT